VSLEGRWVGYQGRTGRRGPALERLVVTDGRDGRNTDTGAGHTMEGEYIYWEVCN